MDAQKEIEKMAKTLYRHYCGNDKCGECKQPLCLDYIRAEKLVNAGYGDVKQAVREFAENLKERMALNGYRSRLHNKIIDELVKEVCEE